MHRLKQKKGKKTVTHHFHHVTEPDGSRKHVYLGTDPGQAGENLTRMKVARIRSQNSLIREMEDVQARLDGIAHQQRKYEDILRDLKIKHEKRLEIERLLGREVREAFPFYGYVLVFIAFMGLTAGAFFLVTTPGITGAAVQGMAAVASNNLVSMGAGMLAVIVILGLVLHHADHRHKHRHDKYKPQF